MTVKLAVSLPDHLAEHAREMVRTGHAPSVSAAIAHALEQHLENEPVESVLADLLAGSGGPATPQELADAGRLLGLE